MCNIDDLNDNLKGLYLTWFTMIPYSIIMTPIEQNVEIREEYTHFHIMYGNLDKSLV